MKYIQLEYIVTYLVDVLPKREDTSQFMQQEYFHVYGLLLDIV